MTFSEAKEKHPEYKLILERIQTLASLERSLTTSEENELKSLHTQDDTWRKKLGLV